MTGHSPLDMPVGAAMVAISLLVSILLLTAWAADAHDRARRRRARAHRKLITARRGGRAA